MQGKESSGDVSICKCLCSFSYFSVCLFVCLFVCFNWSTFSHGIGLQLVTIGLHILSVVIDLIKTENVSRKQG